MVTVLPEEASTVIWNAGRSAWSAARSGRIRYATWTVTPTVSSRPLAGRSISTLNRFSPTDSAAGKGTRATAPLTVAAAPAMLSRVPSGQLLHVSSTPSRPPASARGRAVSGGGLGQNTATSTAARASPPAAITTAMARRDTESSLGAGATARFLGSAAPRSCARRRFCRRRSSSSHFGDGRISASASAPSVAPSSRAG